MIRAVEVDLAQRGVVFPSQEVAMVVAQPFVHMDAVEPYRCTPTWKGRQLAAIARTLEVSLARTHGADKTHFTVLPEYSIPGLEGVAAIDVTLAAPTWPTGTVVIGGVDGLDKAQYTELINEPLTHVDIDRNGWERVQQQEWVNCCVVWVKFPDGTVERWVQPKISPAWEEVNIVYQAMFKGSSAFVFKTGFDDQTKGRFCALICFDWIGAESGSRIWRLVAQSLSNQALAGGADHSVVSWLFVVQRNPFPSHPAFLTQIEAFFDQTIVPTVLRNGACLVMANVAGNEKPGPAQEYGGLSVLHSALSPFAKPDCQPTYGNGGPRQRGTNQLGPVKDGLFRERGACIHSFVQRNPAGVVPGAAGRTVLALSRAHVHAIDDLVDPRVPGHAVPASIKWINDQLDSAPSIGTKHPAVPLAADAKAAHGFVVSQFRLIDARAVQQAMGIACPTTGARLPDDWESSEVQSVAHMLDSLTVLRTSEAPLSVLGQPVHATVTIVGAEWDVIAVRGWSHEMCARHIDSNPPPSHRPVLVITRDDDNTDWGKRFQSFLHTSSADDPADQFRVTDPTSAITYVGYASILRAFKNAPTPALLSGELDVVLTP